MKKNGKSRGREQSAQKQLMLPLRGLAREALWDTVVISGLAFVDLRRHSAKMRFLTFRLFSSRRLPL